MNSKLHVENISNIDRLKVQSLLALRDKNVSDLARELKVSPQYMHDMLRGKRNIRRYAQRIADYLQVPLQKIRERRGGTSLVPIAEGTSRLTQDHQSVSL